MGANTTKGFPYPVSTDSVDVPSDIYRLANAIDTSLVTAATASTIPYRDTNGNISVADPSSSTHAATKNYVDTSFTTKVPLTTTGDILYQSASGPQRLGIGTAGQVLSVQGGIPAWVTSGGGGGGSGTGTGFAQTSGTISANTATTIDTVSVFSGSVTTGNSTIGTVSGPTNGLYTATITGMSSTTNMVAGQTITAVAGTGNFGTGTVTITSVVSSSSITISSTAIFTAGTVGVISVVGPIGIEYLLNMRQGTKSRASTIRVVADGSATPTVNSSEYGVIETGALMSGVNVTVSTSSVNAILQVTVTDAATTPVTWRLSRIAQ